MSKTKEKTLLQQHMEDFEKTRSATGANYAASAGGADAVRESVRNVIGSIEVRPGNSLVSPVAGIA